MMSLTTTLTERAPAMLAPRRALALVTLAAAGLLAGAWWFELVIGLEPCKLCLQQRWPHYAALALGAMALAAGGFIAPLRRPALINLALIALALIFAVSSAMGAYHAGVEWKWWPGPADCAAAAAPRAASTADFLAQLQTTRVVNCAEAPWRWLGLSLAGWNALASVGLTGFAALAWLRSARA
jgi:disulfide bond formation protein DsbB